jgi:hypothetical protein
MSQVKTQLRKVWGVLFLGLLLGGCLTDPISGAVDSAYTGHVTVEVRTAAIPRHQASVVPDLEKLVVTMTSSARDTLYDTITNRGSLRSTEPAWLDGTAGNVHLFVRYELKAGRRWTLAVKTLDRLDSVVHAESLRVEGLQDFEYRAVRIEMAPRWVGYAVRVALPAAMPTAGGSRAVRFNRVELLVDGVIVRDSQAAAGIKFFRAGNASTVSNVSSGAANELVLAHPYVAPGVHAVEFRAYGYLDGDTVGVTPSRLLLGGRTTLNAGLAKAATEEAVPLEWTGDAASDMAAGSAPVSSGLQFRIGAVGTVSMNVVIPGAIDL